MKTMMMVMIIMSKNCDSAVVDVVSIVYVLCPMMCANYVSLSRRLDSKSIATIIKLNNLQYYYSPSFTVVVVAVSYTHISCTNVYNNIIYTILLL